MARQIVKRYCFTCQSMTKAEWSGCNHILHLLLSVVTGGLWLIVWLVLAMTGKYHCSNCGSVVRMQTPPAPRRRSGWPDWRQPLGYAIFGLTGLVLLLAAKQGLDDQQPAAPRPSEHAVAPSADAQGLAAVSASDVPPPRPKPANVRPAPQNWVTGITKSKISDRTNVVLQVNSNETVDCGWRRGQQIELLVYCSENRTSLLINTGCFMTSDVDNYGDVILRLDKQPARTYRMTESTDNKALGLWSGGQSIPIIRQLMAAKTVVVKATPYNESPFVVTFNVAGLDKAIDPVRKSCGW